jgi:hypothetical protein
LSEEPKDFRFLGPVRNVLVIARGRRLRVRWELQDKYGKGNWRKMKGFARIEEDNGYIGDAEIHWYEAHGIGRFEWKIKVRLEKR